LRRAPAKRDTGGEGFVTNEYIEERNGGYYVAGARISLDSIVYSFERGNSPEAIQKEFPLLRVSQIYGAIAFYLDNQASIRAYLETKERSFGDSSIPLAEANPELWARLQRARQDVRKPES
jgi:uncharacterized protein (DUF433 family)